MRRKQFVLPLCAGILATLGLLATPAVAQVACGTTLTTDTTLTSTDPVVFDPVAQPNDTPCAGAGLILGDAITLDCAGLTLKGNSKGVGIDVIKGVEGASILNCVVDTFAIGIQLGGLGSHSVEGGLVINNKGNGVEVLSDFNSLFGVVAQQNGGIGFLVKGVGNAVGESLALQNGKAGFSIGGKEHAFDVNLAILNGADGFTGSGKNTFFSLNKTISNRGNGLTFKGGTIDEPNDYSDNTAITNGKSGILVGGTNPEKEVDSGGNKGLANVGPIQCQIAGLPCQ